MLALRAADATAEWDALSPGKRRGPLYQVTKRSDTRARRIATLIDEVRG